MKNRNRASISLVFALFVFCAHVQGGEMLLYPKDARQTNVNITDQGHAVLQEGCYWGACIWNLTPDGKAASVDLQADIPSSVGLPPSGDVLYQLRWRQDDTWSPWWPENILPGGDFLDSNSNGIPDKVDILKFDARNTIWSDLENKSMPDWVDEHLLSASPSLVVDKDVGKTLCFQKDEAQGQVIVSMRSDRVWPVESLTVSGWNGWEMGNIRTMGLMSRFHEIDREGKRLNKIMFIGDDDWHQPGGSEPLKWRAVTFVPREKTVRLNLYTIRLIAAPGTIKAANYQVRTDSITDYQKRNIASFDFDSSVGWNFSDENLTLVQDNVLTVYPAPHSNSFALSPEFDLPDVQRIGVSVQMDVKVPDRYNDHDPSHKAWASTYLEMLDDEGKVLDVIKVSACRPEFGGALAAAGQVPEMATKARVRLVGSHQSYLPEHMKQNINGEMICRWKQLRIFETSYPMDFRQRLDEKLAVGDELPEAKQFQVRAMLLSDYLHPSPRLKSVSILTGENKD